MADKKISELTNITGANIADGDELVVVDTSASETKAITFGEFKNALDTATGFVSITGDTMTGDLALSGADITFGDNDKAIFGAGSDLQIYHNTAGFTGNIIASATNNLYIRSNSLYFQKADGTENNMFAISDGAVSLAYDNNVKLATTSTGVDITGTLTSDGLTVDGNVANITLNNTDTTIGQQRLSEINFDQNDPDGAGVGTVASIYALNRGSSSGFGALVFQTGTASTLADRMRIEYTGDISFYEDTGTTAKFFWDASAESLGIGTSSPSKSLHILNTSSTGSTNPSHLRIEGNNSNYYDIGRDNSGTGFLSFYGSQTGANGYIFGGVDGERMRIDSSGNVGIGASSPFYAVQVNRTPSASGFDGISVEDSSTVVGLFKTGSSYSFGSVGSNQSWIYSNTSDLNITSDGSGIIKFQGENGSERMRIDSSGNLLVGKTSATTFGTEGIELRANDIVWSTRTSGPSLELNRLTTDGDIAGFYKDGTIVGSITTGAGGYMHIKGGNNTFGSGIAFNNQTWNPTNASGTITDNHVKLGDTTSRFTDLYLSGGVYLGGTGSANKLEDYEEGSWTPVYRVGSSGGSTLTVTGGDQYARYVKVGKLLYLDFGFGGSTVSGSSGGLYITGFPFVFWSTGNNSLRTRGSTISYINGFNTSGTVDLFSENTYALVLSQGATTWSLPTYTPTSNSYFHATLVIETNA